MTTLFSPLQLAGLTLANRIVVSPMCQYSANDGCASGWHMTHLGMLANSGASLLMLEATHVERRGRITHGCLGLYSDACEYALAPVVAHCRAIGSARLGIQLAHAGRKGSAQRPWQGGGALGPAEDPWPTLAPSALPFGDNWHIPGVASEADMARVRGAFVEAARRAVRIGLEVIELHMAHGYLLHEFLSPLANTRTDAYGGSLDNRLRFPLEVARAVRDAVPAEIALGARITGSDWHDGGITPEEAVACARALKAERFDYVDISSGGVRADIRNPVTAGYNAPIAARVKREADIAVRTVGAIVTPQQAQALVADGSADMVALGRAMLDDPHWGWHAAQALGVQVPLPAQYERAGPKFWPPAAKPR
jgi:NADPH2 dehydrogenase